LVLYTSDVVGIVSTSNGEPPGVLYNLGKQNLPGNGELTDSTPSLSSKVFPNINDFLAGAPELLGEQPVSLQGYQP